MAAATISIEQDQFSCSVCLEVLREPVTIPCGHSYCLECIEDYWHRRDKPKSQYSCPQCRQVFNPRPLLSRNTVLGEVVDKFLQSGRPTPPQQQQQQQQQQQRPLPARAKEVKCTVCSGTRATAVCSCLACAHSYCAAHLKAHDAGCRGKALWLVPPADRPDDRPCPQHRRPLRLFCRAERQHVCSQCVKERHASHDVVPAAEERAAQQKKLQEASLKSIQKLKDVEKELRYVIRYIKHSTEAAVEESERIFSRLIRSIEKQSREVTELLRFQERAAVTQAEELLEKIQREVVEVRRTDGELEKLSSTDDHIHFLQECKSLHFPMRTVEMPNTDTLPYLMYKGIRGALYELKDGLNENLERELNKISDKVVSLKEASNQNTSVRIKGKDADTTYNLEPKTRADFLQYSNDIALDPNTANAYLSFSNGRREVTTHSDPQPYPDHPSRFTSWAQVLCRAGMAGRCYWEVEWGGAGGVSIGVCYKSMGRSGGGSDCKLGHNPKSWSLDCSYTACSFQHNKDSASVSSIPCGRIGVYLDFRGGALSFYNVSEQMVLLHKARATFSQPVYPGFWVGLGSYLKLCSL